MNSVAPVRVYFARTATPGLIFGSSNSVSGSGSITVTAAEWTEITNDLGPSPVYYWTIGSGNDDGKTLYANWQPITDRRAKLLSPLDGVTLPASATTFTWDSGSGAQSYTLWVGSEPGTSDIHAGNEGANRSRSVTLPTDGRPLYVRLWSMLDGTLEQFFDYSFIAQKAGSLTVKSQMVYPTNGSTFGSDTVAFAWDSGTGAQKYALWVGTTPGASDIFAADEGTKLAESVKVPTDGQPVYVRLWTMFNGTWEQFNTYVYTSRLIASEPAKLLAPNDRTTLASQATTFRWDAGTRAEGYALWVGSSLGASDLYSGIEGMNLSKSLSIPADGRPIYVRLSTMFNGKWERYNSYSFTAPTTPTANIKAQMLTPANASTLSSSSVDFTWNAGSGALEYWLSAGSTLGGTNYYNQPVGKSQSVTGVGVPANGSTVYVRLWTRFSSDWGTTSATYNDYAYTSQFVQAAEATMISPADRSTLPLGPTTFTWTPGGRAEQYVLWVGSNPGASDLYSASEDLRTSKTLTLPADGRPIYVKLWTKIDGKLERSRSYIYTTSIAPAPAKAQLTSPANGSTLASGTLDLQWTNSTSAEKYALWVGTTPGGSDIYGSDEEKNSSRSVTVPTVGQQIYVRLWTLLGGTWGYNDYAFSAPVAAGALARLTAPANGSVLPTATTTFTWDAGSGAQLYSLWVGSSPDTNDIYSGVEGLGRSRTLTLPRDGRPLYVQLWTMLDGTWSQSNYYNFTAFSPPAEIKADLVSPAAGSLLPLGTTTFTWNSGVGATQYALWIGSTPDANDLYSGTEGTNLSKTISLPTDGRPVYVRLWSMFNGEWQQYNSYSFTTPINPGPAKAQILAPANGITLASSSATFSWNTGSGGQQYSLSAGSTPGGTDYFNQSVGTSLSQAVTGLPTDGSTIYVRLWTKFAGSWGTNYNDYAYTAAKIASPGALTVTIGPAVAVSAGAQWQVDGGAWRSNGATASSLTAGNHTVTFKAASGYTTPASQTVTVLSNQTINASGTYVATVFPTAVMVTPVPGSTLTGSSQTFTWNPGSQATEYWLNVGSKVGAGNYFYASTGSALTQAVTGLPTNGSTIYVRLWTNLASGWVYTDYTYTATGVASLGALTVAISPAGAAGAGAQWQVDGGGWQNSGATVSSLSAGSHTVTFKAASGYTAPASQTVTVLANQTINASGTYSAAASPAAVMATPVPGSTLTGSSQTFTWNAGSQATEYWLSVGSTPGGGNYFYASTGLVLKQAVTGLPTNGSTIYARLWTNLASGWVYTDYTYTAATISSIGALTVALSPAGAVLAGAQWQVDGGGWQSGGATVSSLSAGSHTVAFKAATGYTAPASQTVTVLANQTINASGTYTAAVSPTAVMATPVPGSTLTGSSQTFTWNAGSQATEYWLSVGSKLGGGTYFYASTGSALTQAVTGLPTNGSTIYVRLWTNLASGWVYTDYTYTAATISSIGSLTVALSPASAVLAGAQWQVDGGAWQGNGATVNALSAGSHTVAFKATTGYTTPASQTVTVLANQTLNASGTYVASNSPTAVMATPVSGSTLTGSTQTFTWNAGSQATEYWIYVGNKLGGANYINTSTASALKQTVSGLPTNGSTIYVRLWTSLSGTWVYTDYTYTASN